METFKCQMLSKDTMHKGIPQFVHLSFPSRLYITLNRYIDPRVMRFIKQFSKRLTGRQASINKPVGTLPEVNVKPLAVLQVGDVVRIRSLEEIRTTLNSRGRLKGCRFMPEMEPYCGTVQRVFKILERYLNETDYTVRKSKGLVLLENVFCQGVDLAGRCDRSCFYFWRVEWLEKVEDAR